MGEKIVMVPPGLPALSRGSHRHPTQGSCLMEYVSVLAGEPFSDRPGCTHPVLAELARKVNDRIGDSVRSRLALLAPELIGTAGTHPGIIPTVLLRCADTGLAVAPEDDWLQRLRRRELAHLARQNGTGPRRGWMRRGAHHRLLAPASRGSVAPVFTRVAAIFDRVNIPDRDQRLCALLEQAVIDCRRLLELPDPRWATSGPGAVLRRGVS